MSIGGRSRASALAAGRPRRRKRLPRKGPNWRCSSRRRMKEVHDDEEGEFDGGGGWHSPSLDARVCFPHPSHFGILGGIQTLGCQCRAQRFRFVSITSQEDEILRRSTSTRRIVIFQDCAKWEPGRWLLLCRRCLRIFIGPSGPQNQSHRISASREGAEERGRSRYERRRGYASVPAREGDYAAAAAYNQSPGTLLVAHHLFPNGCWLACQFASKAVPSLATERPRALPSPLRADWRMDGGRSSRDW